MNQDAIDLVKGILSVLAVFGKIVEDVLERSHFYLQRFDFFWAIADLVA